MSRFNPVLALSLFALLAVAGGCATVHEKHEAVCAFENTETGDCVVDLRCNDEDPELCNVVMQHVKTRQLGVPPELAAQGRVCDNNPLFCTCCDVKNGCYPCPKKVEP